jgi:hypothetical protein
MPKMQTGPTPFIRNQGFVQGRFAVRQDVAQGVHISITFAAGHHRRRLGVGASTGTWGRFAQYRSRV